MNTSLAPVQERCRTMAQGCSSLHTAERVARRTDLLLPHLCTIVSTATLCTYPLLLTS
jgi:hypothetical protein